MERGPGGKTVLMLFFWNKCIAPRTSSGTPQTLFSKEHQWKRVIITSPSLNPTDNVSGMSAVTRFITVHRSDQPSTSVGEEGRRGARLPLVRENSRLLREKWLRVLFKREARSFISILRWNRGR